MLRVLAAATRRGAPALSCRCAAAPVHRLAAAAGAGGPPKLKVNLPSEGRIGKQALQVTELMLVGVTGTKLGVMPPQEALDLAEKDGLRLVEVAPKATPTVWRLLVQEELPEARGRKPALPADDGASEAPAAPREEAREQTEEQKRVAAVKKRAAMGKKPRVKEVRILDRCQEHDVETKVNHTLGFLGKGIVVKVTAAGGPQTDGGQQTDRAQQLIQRFIDECAHVATSTGLARSGTHVATTLEPKG